MDKTALQLTPGLSPAIGYTVMIGLGLASLAIAVIIRAYLVRNTHDFIISNRKVGFGFGVGSVIAVWTWAMAVMMSAAMTFQWGLSGLFWFVVPNGFAVMAMIPFARVLRKSMPHGYTISEFTAYRFNQSQVASAIVTATMIFGIILEILINLKGTSIVISSIFGIDWEVAAIVGISRCSLTQLRRPVDERHDRNHQHFDDHRAGGDRRLAGLRQDSRWSVGGHRRRRRRRSAQSLRAAPGRCRRLRHHPRLRAARGHGRRPDVLAEGMVDPCRPGEPDLPVGGRALLPIPICLGMLGLVGIAFGLTAADVGGDIAAVGPYIVSHVGLPAFVVVVYVLVILAACYSTIDGASAALSSIVAVDIVRRYAPRTPEKALFAITKISTSSAARSRSASCFRESISRPSF